MKYNDLITSIKDEEQLVEYMQKSIKKRKQIIKDQAMVVFKKAIDINATLDKHVNFNNIFDMVLCYYKNGQKYVEKNINLNNFCMCIELMSNDKYLSCVDLNEENTVILMGETPGYRVIVKLSVDLLNDPDLIEEKFKPKVTV